MCTFIEAVTTNTYNEYGEIYTEPVSGIYKWTRKVTASQIFMLLLSVSVFCGLSAYAVHLHLKLYRRKPWTPPARFSIRRDSDDCASEAGRISRHNSGIIAMRSRSYDAPHPYVAYSGSIPHKRNEIHEANSSYVESNASSTQVEDTEARPDLQNETPLI